MIVEWVDIAELSGTQGPEKTTPEIIDTVTPLLVGGWDIAVVPPIRGLFTTTGVDILDGHHRVDAARRAGLLQVPVYNDLAMRRGDRTSYAAALKRYRKRIKHPLSESMSVEPVSLDIAALIDATPEGEYGEIQIGPSTIMFREKAGAVTVVSLRTPAAHRGTGAARAAMLAFLAGTDKLGITTELIASPLNSKTSRPRLIAFYESLGYRLTGKLANPAGDPRMERAAPRRSQRAAIEEYDQYVAASISRRSAPRSQRMAAPATRAEFKRWLLDRPGTADLPAELGQRLAVVLDEYPATVAAAMHPPPPNHEWQWRFDAAMKAPHVDIFAPGWPKPPRGGKLIYGDKEWQKIAAEVEGYMPWIELQQEAQRIVPGTEWSAVSIPYVYKAGHPYPEHPIEMRTRTEHLMLGRRKAADFFAHLEFTEPWNRDQSLLKYIDLPEPGTPHAELLERMVRSAKELHTEYYFKTDLIAILTKVHGLPNLTEHEAHNRRTQLSKFWDGEINYAEFLQGHKLNDYHYKSRQENLARRTDREQLVEEYADLMDQKPPAGTVPVTIPNALFIYADVGSTHIGTFAKNRMFRTQTYEEPWGETRLYVEPNSISGLDFQVENRMSSLRSNANTPSKWLRWQYLRIIAVIQQFRRQLRVEYPDAPYYHKL